LSSNHAGEVMIELATATGLDNHEYSVAPMAWNLAKVEEYWKKISNFSIFSDEVERTSDGFLNIVTGLGALWFEIMDLTDHEVVGLMYITDIVKGANNTFASAVWHAMLWDAKAGPRRPILKASVRALFRKFGFHRLQAEIPCNHGGVIRAARKIGFTPEGRLREHRRYNGVWYDSVVLGILEHEVEQ
jgi:RimJ/RimL family protein N-acetyltransferase